MASIYIYILRPIWQNMEIEQQKTTHVNKRQKCENTQQMTKMTRKWQKQK